MFKTVCIYLLLFCAAANAQVQGTVTDGTTYEPIPFVNVWVLNKDKGTTADENGKYILAAAEATDTLLFSAVGYADTKNKSG
jgi:hypothetical protein